MSVTNALTALPVAVLVPVPVAGAIAVQVLSNPFRAAVPVFIVPRHPPPP